MFNKRGKINKLKKLINKMPLKRHHKIMIGGFSTFLIGLLIANSLFIYFLYGQLQLSYNRVEVDIKELQAETK